MRYWDIVKEVAKQLNLSAGHVDNVYRAYWKTIREYISSLPLKEDLSEEEFSKLQPNVNIPSIGKLYVTFDRYNRMKKYYSIIEENKKKK